MDAVQLTTDLRMLVYTSVLAFIIPMAYGAARVMTPGGAKWGIGNREGDKVAFPAWSMRAERAHANLLENLAPFAILVLVAHLSGQANDVTALAARIFFWARVAHAGVYMAGITRVRTAVFVVSLAAELVILFQILA
jgi:uncharacterized MAPEG superfamily protein